MGDPMYAIEEPDRNVTERIIRAFDRVIRVEQDDNTLADEVSLDLGRGDE